MRAGSMPIATSIRRDAGFTLPPGAPSIRLDYLLVPEPMLSRVARCEPASTLPLVDRASDHLPLVVELDTGDDAEEGQHTAAG